MNRVTLQEDHEVCIQQHSYGAYQMCQAQTKIPILREPTHDSNNVISELYAMERNMYLRKQEKQTDDSKEIECARG